MALKIRLEEQYARLQRLAYNMRRAQFTEVQKPYAPTYQQKESYAATPSLAPADAGKAGSVAVVSAFGVGYMRIFDRRHFAVPHRGRDRGYPWHGRHS